MGLELELAIRFLRRRTGMFLRGTALAAFAGVALAVAALVVTLALMAGYSRAIAGALQQGNAHMVGFAPDPMALAAAGHLADRMATVKGVRRAGPVTYLAGLIEDPLQPANPLPVVLKAVAQPPAYTGLDSWPDSEGALPAVIGVQLATTLDLAPGAGASVLVPPQAATWLLPSLPIEVAGTFSLAFAEFDERWLIVPLDRLLLSQPRLGVAGIEVELEDPMAIGRVRQPLGEIAPGLVLSDWREMNSALFAALRWQTLSLFVVLSLVVAVASFQVSSALVVLAIDKRRTTGMLQALGATPARIVRVLVLAGVVLGSSGVVTGMVIGCTLSYLASALRIIRFPQGLARVYMVDHIPLEVQPVHLLAVAGVCGALVVVASLWPALKTSRLDPVTALKAV